MSVLPQSEPVRRELPAWQQLLELLRLSPDGLLVADMQGRILGANEALCSMSGHGRDELLSKSIVDLEAPPSQPGTAGHLAAMFAAGKERFVGRWRCANGQLIDVDISLTTRGDPEVLIAFVRYVSAMAAKADRLERGRALYAFLIEANAICARIQDIPSLYGEICALAPRMDPRILLAWIGLQESGQGSVRVAASGGGARAYLDGIDISLDAGRRAGQGPTARAIREGRCVVVNDFLTDPTVVPWREKAARFGIAASASIPLFEQGRAIGALMLYSSESATFDEELIELLIGLGKTITNSIEFSRQREESRLIVDVLQRSERRYRLLAENVRDVIWSFDLDTLRFVYVSPSVTQMIGLSPADLIGQGLGGVVTEASAEEISTWIEQDIVAWRNGTFKPRTQDVEYVRRDGSTIWTEVVVQLHVDTDSGHLQAHGVTRDISERRIFLEMLEQSRENLHAILDSTDESIVMVEADGDIVAINQTGARRLGAQPQEIIGTRLYGHMAPAVASLRRSMIEDAVASRQQATFEDIDQGRTFRNRVFPMRGDSRRAVVFTHDITDAVAAELRLLESEQRYRTMFENSHSAMLIVDPDSGKIIDANVAACKFYGWPKGQFLTKHISDINTLSDSELKAEMRRAALGEKNHFEFRHRRADGSIVDVDVFSGSIQIAGRRLLHTIVYDISERKRGTQRSQALLKIAEMAQDHDEVALLKQGLELAEQATDSRIGFLHFVNDDQESIELVTWTDGALRGCTAAHDAHYPISQAGIWANCFRERQAVVFNDYATYAAKRGLPDGHAPLQRLISVPVIEDGMVRAMLGVGNKDFDYIPADIETVQLIGNDLWRIVRRQRAEKELRSARDVIEASPVVGFRWLAQPGWPVDFVSGNVIRWGYTPEQFVSGEVAYCDIVHPDDLARVASEVQTHTDAHHDSYVQEYRLRAADGHYFWVEDHTRIVRDAQDVALYYEGVVSDVDERKTAEQELATNLVYQKELNRKIEEAHNQLLQSEKMASIGQLAAGVAHELNNPIGFVNSNLGTLETYLQDIFEIAAAYQVALEQSTDPDTVERIKALKIAKDFDYLASDIFQLTTESREGLGRMRKIVQDLRDFSRVGDVEWQIADLHAGLESTLNIVWNELKYKCTVVKHYAVDLPSIRCVPSQLNQVFMNLLVNAAHAIEKWGTITITTRLCPTDPKAIQLLFSDTGSGIAPDILSRIFDPFFTTKPIGKGTGLGLSIVWGIIARHRGKIEVESTLGQGTTFTITLPIDQPDHADAATTFPASNTAVPPSLTFEKS